MCCWFLCVVGPCSCWDLKSVLLLSHCWIRMCTLHSWHSSVSSTLTQRSNASHRDAHEVTSLSSTGSECTPMWHAQGLMLSRYTGLIVDSRLTSVDRLQCIIPGMHCGWFCSSADLNLNIPCAAEHDTCKVSVGNHLLSSATHALHHSHLFLIVSMHTVICRASSECVLSLWLPNTLKIGQRSDCINF